MFSSHLCSGESSNSQLFFNNIVFIKLLVIYGYYNNVGWEINQCEMEWFQTILSIHLMADGGGGIYNVYDVPINHDILWFSVMHSNFKKLKLKKKLFCLFTVSLNKFHESKFYSGSILFWGNDLWIIHNIWNEVLYFSPKWTFDIC